MRLEVTINGAMRAPLIKGSNFRFGVGEISRATLKFFATDANEFAIHQTVAVTNPVSGATIFLGYIVSLRITKPNEMAAGQWSIDATCQGREWLMSFPPQLYTAVHQRATDQAILIDMLIKTGISAEIKYASMSGALTGGGIPGGPNIIPGDWSLGGQSSSVITVQVIAAEIDASYAGRTPREIADELAATSGGIWYVDLDTLYYNAHGTSGAAAWDIDNDAPNGIDKRRIFRLNVERHWEKPMTDITVLGLFDGLRQPRAVASVAGTPPRRFARIYESEAILTVEMAQAVADALIATTGAPDVSASFSFVEPTEGPALKANTIISITDAEHGLSGAIMLIRSVAMKQEDGEKTRYDVTAGDIRPSQEQLLRRIEAMGKRRQQNLPQLIRGIDFRASSSHHVSSANEIELADDMTDFTLFATIRPDSLTAQMTIVAKETPTGRGWSLQVGTSSISLVRTKDSTNYEYSRLHGFVAGGVYRIVVRSSAVQGSRFWSNGRELTSGGGNLGSFDFDTEEDAPIRVGRRQSGMYFDGLIATVAVWNFAMPETTCPTVHNLKFNDLPVQNSLVLAWEMGEFNRGTLATGTGAVRDSSGNNYHGTPQNGPVGDSVIYQP